MTSSFGPIVIRFICPDLGPVVWVCISEPSFQSGFGRVGPFLNWRELWYIKRDSKTNNFLKLELDYIWLWFDPVTIKRIRMKPDSNPSGSHRH